MPQQGTGGAGPYGSIAVCQNTARAETKEELAQWGDGGEAPERRQTNSLPLSMRESPSPLLAGPWVSPTGGGSDLRGEKGVGHAEEAARAVSATASNSTADMGHRLERHEEQSCPIAAISCTCIEAVPFPAGTRFYTGRGGHTHQLFQKFPHAANDTLDGQCGRALGHSPCPVDLWGCVMAHLHLCGAVLLLRRHMRIRYLNTKHSCHF